MGEFRKDGGFSKELMELFEEEYEQQILEKTKPLIKRPSMYEVVLLDDDVTPMEFVVMILKTIFHKAEAEAVEIMLNTHNNGKGCCGLYTRDIAETKMSYVVGMARENGYPLKCIISKT